MLRTLLSGIFMVCICNFCYAQDDDNDEFSNSLGIKTGWIDFRFRDRVISTYLYTGGTIPFQAEYIFDNKKFHSSTNVVLNVADSVNTRAGILQGFAYKGDDNTFVNDTIGYLDQRTVQLTYVNFNFDLLRKLDLLKSTKWQVSVGGGFNFISINKKFLSLFYTNRLSDRLYSLQLAGSIEYRPNKKNTFEYTLYLPLINRTHRVLHLEEAVQASDSYRKWTFYNEYFVVNSKLRYQFKIARHWSLEALYQFNFMQCTFPRKEQFVAQSLVAGINFHF